MTIILRQVKSFRGNTHEALTEEINKWVNTTHSIPISMTVSGSNSDFFGFVIYELPIEKQRHLGVR